MRPLASKSSRRPGSISESSPSTMPATSCRRSPCPAGQRLLDVRAQPVGDATDPAPPADDPWCWPRTTTCTPRRASHPRSSKLVSGRRGATGRARTSRTAPEAAPLGWQLEQDPLADRWSPNRVISAGRRSANRVRRGGPVTTNEPAPTRRGVARESSGRARRRGASPTRGRMHVSATPASASLGVSRSASAQQPAQIATSPIPSRGGRTQWPAAIPRQAAATRRAGQFVSTARRTTARRLRGSPSSRSCSMRAGPIPGTSSRSSTDRKGPFDARQSTIFCAVTGPIPGARRAARSSRCQG